MSGRAAVRRYRGPAALLALAAVLALGLFLRLAHSPLVFDALRPTLEAALSPETGEIAVRIEHTALRWRRGPRVLALGTRILGPDERVLARFPEIAVRLSLRALLGGRVAPLHIEVLRPVVRIARARDGELEIGLVRDAAPRPPEESPIAGLIEVMTNPQGAGPLGSLKRIRVIDADLEIEDRMLGVTWRAPQSELELIRGSGGLAAEAALELDLAGHRSNIDARLEYDRRAGAIAVSLNVAALDPELIGLAFPELELDRIVSVGIPISGDLTVRLLAGEASSAIEVTDVDFDLRGAPGSLHLHGLALDPVAVDGLHLAGGIHDQLSHIELHEARLEFGGATLTVGAWSRPTGEDVALRLEARVTDFDVANLGALWPRKAASKARDWVVPNIPSGLVAEGRFALSAQLVAGRFDEVVIDSLEGSLDARDLVVHYLDPLPAATGVSSEIRFDRDRFDFTLGGGRIGDLTIAGGELSIAGMSGKDQVMSIDGRVRGPLRTALALLDHEPLGLLRDFRFDLSGTEGRMETRLRLDFPLETSLQLGDLAIDSSSSLRAVESPEGPFGLSLREGALQVEASDRRMRVSGELEIAGEPAQIDWYEDFGTAPVVSHIELSGRANGEARRVLGLDPDPLAGPVPLELVYRAMRDGSGVVELDLDLTDADLDLAWLDWSKPGGVEGSARLVVAASADGAVAIESVQLAASDLVAEGQIFFDGDPLALREISAEQLRWADNDVSGRLRRGTDGAYELELGGNRLRLGPLLEWAAEAREGGELPAFSLRADFDELGIGGSPPLTDFHGVVGYDGSHFEQARIDFRADTALGSLRYDPMGSGRTLAIRVGNFGNLLRATPARLEMKGGALVIDGARTSLDSPVEGRFSLLDFSVESDVSLTRLLQALSLVDLLDALRRDGLGFRSLDGRFVYRDGTLELRDAKAVGASLGFTIRGSADLGEFTADLEGEVLPLYVMNTMVGRIPLVGPAVTGKDGALVSRKYRATGALGDLSVRVGKRASAPATPPPRSAPEEPAPARGTAAAPDIAP